MKTATDQDSAQQERDRYQELLQELRVVLPGAEVLFAFLLTSVFARRFLELDELGRAGYTVALLATALAVVAFSAPTVYHRLTPREQRQRRMEVAVVLQVVGTTLVGVATSSAIFVVVRLMYGYRLATLVAGVVALAWVGLWYVFPLLTRTGPPDLSDRLTPTLSVDETERRSDAHDSPGRSVSDIGGDRSGFCSPVRGSSTPSDGGRG